MHMGQQQKMENYFCLRMIRNGPDKETHQMKSLATMPEGQCSMHRIHLVDGEN